MGKIRVVHSADVQLLAPTEGQSSALVPVDEPGDKGAVRHLHPGSETDLYLHEAHTPPNAVIEPHVHRSDEIIYVTRGELHLGARVLPPGSSVYIPADTLYGFRAGPDGLSFLNFRAHRDNSHVLKEEFLAERGGSVDGETSS